MYTVGHQQLANDGKSGTAQGIGTWTGLKRGEQVVMGQPGRLGSDKESTMQSRTRQGISLSSLGIYIKGGE